MSTEGFINRAYHVIERFILFAVQVLLVLVIGVALVVLWYLFLVAIRNQLGHVTSVDLLTDAVQRAFGGVLLIILGLELLETLRVYFTHHRVRLEVILAVAIIAIGRHVINLDLEHLPGTSLAGIAALVVALTLGYYLVRRDPGGAKPRSGAEER